MFQCAPVSWTLARQSVVADSTCEAEHLAAITATQQTRRLRRLLFEAHMPESQPTALFVEYKAKILVA